MQKIAQAEGRQVKVMVNLHERYRRHLKAEAARLGKDMGSVIEDALDKFIGPPPPPPDMEEGNAAE